MGLGQTHKHEFKMRSTCITKKRGQLMQVEWKWCDGLNKDNLKNKLYTTCNLWEEAPLPSLYYILCFSIGTTSKCHFSPGLPSDSQVGVPKLGLLLSQNFGCSYFFQIKFFWKFESNFLYYSKIYFQQCITRLNQSSFDPCFQKVCG
jgi:hypothetical protein